MLVDFLTNLGFITASCNISLFGLSSLFINGFYHYMSLLIAFFGSLLELLHPFSPICEFSRTDDYLLDVY